MVPATDASADGTLPNDLSELLRSLSLQLKKQGTGQRKELLEALRQLYRFVALSHRTLEEEQLRTLHAAALPLLVSSSASSHPRTSALATGIAALLLTLPVTKGQSQVALRPLLFVATLHLCRSVLTAPQLSPSC